MRIALPSDMPASVERPRLRVGLGGLGLLVALASAFAAAPAAHAGFSETYRQPCTGGAVEGEGSSAQKVAQQEVWPVTFADYCAGFSRSAPSVTYDPDGSGCGLASMGAGGTTTGCLFESALQFEPTSRNASTRFGGSDAPPTALQKSNMEGHEGAPHYSQVHVLPVAAFSVAVAVHFPQGCELEDPEQPGGNADTTTGNTEAGSNDPPGKETGDTFAAETLRPHIEAKMLEEIWEGKPKTWGQVLERSGTVHMVNPEAKPTAAIEEEEKYEHCKEVPVRRAVRKDGSGTTFNFKSYLSLLVPSSAHIWTELPVAGTGQVWPLTPSEKSTPPEAPDSTEEVDGKKLFADECNKNASVHLICTGNINGNEGVLHVVEKTDGSIGYTDLATARQEGFTVTPHSHDGTYWIPLQTVDPAKSGTERIGSNYVEPSENPKANLSTEPESKGANCVNADVREIPSVESSPNQDPTLGNWENALASGSLDSTTYPACGLTYDFAFQDNGLAYSGTPAEEASARTVKDYLSAVTSTQGQQELLAKDYGELPPTIDEWARRGVEAITFSPGGGTPPPPPPPPAPGPGTGGGGEVAKTASNAFSIASTKVKNKHIVVSLVLPGSGQVKATAKGGGITVSSLTASVGGGQGKLELPISKAGQNKVDKAKSGKLKVTITITFTPTGGSAAMHSESITLTKALLSVKGKTGKSKKHKKK